MPNKNDEVTLRKMRQTAMLGRYTCIVEVACIEVENIELVLKISFPSTTLTSEVNILDAIVGSASEDEEWAHLHPPMMSSSNDNPSEPLCRYLQDQNLQFMGNGRTFVYEKPITRLILSEKLTSIDDLREPRNYAQVFFDILQTHRWLYEVPKILHGDLSQGNIMIRRDSKGRYRGVLNDWDPPSHFKDIGQGATSHVRTGTRPFMAHELHLTGSDGPPMHRYRHDLESLFFIMVLLFCRNTLNPGASSEGPLRPYRVEGFKAWDSRDDVHLQSAKRVFLMVNCEHFPLSGFDSFRGWIHDLHHIFFRALILKGMKDMMGEDGGPELLLKNITYDPFFAVMASFKHTPKSAPLIVTYPPS